MKNTFETYKLTYVDPEYRDVVIALNNKHKVSGSKIYSSAPDMLLCY